MQISQKSPANDPGEYSAIGSSKRLDANAHFAAGQTGAYLRGTSVGIKIYIRGVAAFDDREK